MNYRRVLHSTFFLALGLATIGNVDHTRKMPAPRIYGAVVIVWWVLGIASDFGPRMARLAGIFSGLLVLTMMMGKMGTQAVAWLQARTVQFGGAGAAAPPAATTTGAAGVFPTLLSTARAAGADATGLTAGAAAAGRVAGAAAPARPVLRPRSGPRDMAALKATDRYSSPALVAAARRAAGGMVPHMVMQEGEHHDAKGRYAWVKFEDPRGGSDTRKVYY